MVNRFQLLFLACMLAGQTASSQHASLLWEISGNGLSKPSYLFGTMHVSNKMAFNLNDSFYDALSRVETVSLEVNPETWQADMSDMESRKDRIEDYGAMAGNDFLYESSLRIKDYTSDLKEALQRQPLSINLLLYRSQKTRDDFEEDTYLDMYIYQAGRRLGKKATGLENYILAEKMMLEALAAMGREKRPAVAFDDATPAIELLEKLEDAYRQGDLDKIDSIDRSMYRSEAFREIFINRRNEIQAAAIDSLLKTTSLFAGIGAAHLPGDRGVINLLRQRGYQLRPVMVSGQSATRKSELENMVVPAEWSIRHSEDGFISADMPGPWYRSQNEPSLHAQWQYADMANGAYYTLTRISTYAAFRHIPAGEIRKKADSLLYENIPGKIIEKTYINDRLYPGIEVVSRNRRGDIQRLQLFVTPFEVILLKVSGTAVYMQSPGPERFFSSIQFHPVSGDGKPVHAGSGVRVALPGWKQYARNQSLLPIRDEFLSVDSATGKAYLLFRVDMHQFGLIGEDSIDLRLMEASFLGPETSGRLISRQWTRVMGYPGLEIKEVMSDSSYRETLFMIKGPHYYVWSLRHPVGVNKLMSLPGASFSFLPPTSSPVKTAEDTALQCRTMTLPQAPIDEELRNLMSGTSGLPLNLFQSLDATPYWPKMHTGIFRHALNGELAMVQFQPFPLYYHILDTAVFWQEEIRSRSSDGDLYLGGPVKRFWRNGQPGISFEFRDTGSIRSIQHQLILDGKGLLSLTFISDTLSGPEPLASSLSASLTTLSAGTWKDRLTSRVPAFFHDLLSADSLTSEKALQAMREVYFGEDAIARITAALGKIDPAGYNYDKLKSRLIIELGDIKESHGNRVVAALEKIYRQVSDTVIFQQEVVRALARHKTAASYRLLARIMVQDPPVYESEYDYKNLFNHFYDSLRISAGLFPHILPLYTSQGLKPVMLSLLADLVDSGFVSRSTYAPYFDAILLDARVELKKLRAKDEKQAFGEAKKSKDDQLTRVFTSNEDNDLLIYARLLLPFYQDRPVVKDLFSRLLQTRDETVRIKIISMMAARKYPVADSLFIRLAADDRYRIELWKKLELVRAEHLFPQVYRTQEWMARSELMAENEYDRMDSLSLVGKRYVVVSGRPGWVYFFKYRLQSSGAWKLGICGPQPGDLQKLSSGSSKASLTDNRLNELEPLDKQVEEPFRKWLLGLYPSGKKFYQEIMPYQFIRTGMHHVED